MFSSFGVSGIAASESLSSPSKSLAYRPAIDGLRAIAVLSVIGFHLSPGSLPGGFAGVDIFFVISGFLIAKILLRDCAENRLSFSRFYQRRIARLFPSLFLVSLVVLAAGSFVYLPHDLAASARHMVLAVISCANFGELSDAGGYFGVVKDSHPYLHFWSLSVEEQFYVLFPAMLFLLFRFARNRVKTALIFLFMLSFVACIVITARNQSWAFFMLPTRAWELLAGSIVAAKKEDSTADAPSRFAGAASWVGLAFIALSFAVERAANFPGYVALLPVMGAVGVIGGSSLGASSAERLLSSAPLVLIGRMSYTLYLWHWPVSCLVDYRLYASPTPLRLALKVGLIFLASALTFYVIETPARAFLNRPQSRRMAFSFAALMLAITIPLGVWVSKRNYLRAHLISISPAGTVAAQMERRLFWLADGSGAGSGGALTFNDTGRRGSLMLMGDSHASMLGTMLRELAMQEDMKLSVISMSGKDPLPGGKNHDSAWWNSLEVVKLIRPDYLIVEDQWVDKLKFNPQRLAVALDALRPYTHRIILITQPPILPPEGSRDGIRHGAHPPFREARFDKENRLRANAVVKSVAGPGITVIDSDPNFRNPDGSIPFTDSLGRQLYVNSSHISRYGADRLRSAIQSTLRP